MIEVLGEKNFLMGDTPCIADFILFEHMEFAQKLNEGTTWATYPTLEAYHGRIANLSGLKEFLASDRMIRDTWLPPMVKC